MPIFHAIAAMSENRVIGHQGRIPWHIPDDFRWFKHKTMGGTLVMGRKTFESIGKPLPGRKTLVLTHRPLEVASVETCSLSVFLGDYVNAHADETYWIAGGGTIYTQLLDHCAYLYITTVKRQEEGDTFFPPLWHVEKNHFRDQSIYENTIFRVERWQHKDLSKEMKIPYEAWPFPEKPR